MQIHFRKLANADEPLHIHDVVDVSEVVKGRKDILTVAPLSVDLKALPAGTDCVNVVGKLSGDVDMLCSRCLTEVKSDLNIPLLRLSSGLSSQFFQMMTKMRISFTSRMRLWILSRMWKKISYCTYRIRYCARQTVLVFVRNADRT